MGRAALRKALESFDACYDDFVVGHSFVEDQNYYIFERRRYRRTFRKFCKLELPANASLLEIGGGQFAILCHHLLGHPSSVADVSSAPEHDIRQAGLGFTLFNLLDGDPAPDQTPEQTYDIVVMLEVIEHLPVPPYVIFNRLSRLLNPGGHLIVTTPNLFRLRNVMYMLAGRDFLDMFQEGKPGISLGHQLEYSKRHMAWQIQASHLAPVSLSVCDLAGSGHSKLARFFHVASLPLYMIPHFRPSLWLVAKKPADFHD